MSGTNHSTSGFRRITRRLPRWNVRLALFAALVAAGLFLIARVQSNVSGQMTTLEQEFGALKAEGFYVGVQLRLNLRRLNEQVLDFQLSSDPNRRQEVARAGEQLYQWLEARKTKLHTARERELFGQIELAYARYLSVIQPLLRTSKKATPEAFVSAYRTVQENSRALLTLIEDFILAQQAAFNAFMQTSQVTLLALQRLLTLSVITLMGSTVVLAALLYRGMIGPLRRSLSESQTVIARQEKLASLGTLAAGVAHEIRNPLTALKFRLFSLRKTLPAEFANHEDTEVISAELNRLERIVRDFLQFARPSDPEPVSIPAGRLLEEVRNLMAPQLAKSAIVLQVEAAPPAWVSADAQQMKQVLINLVQNAAECIRQDGAISLRLNTGEESLRGKRRPAAVLSVTDTGPGIPPEVEKRLFDPFFSTKEGGTGLGLAIAARIVGNHGGLLRYQTRLHRGTTFEIVLPLIDDHGTPTVNH